ncbi:MAG: glycosyltransferase family A protein [Bacteroidales bacterium]
MKPIVSIIIPVYNREKHLHETLSYVSAIQYSNLEVIIVDDGSTDNSKQIANEFVLKSSNTSLILQTNQGVSAARNTGIAQAKGKYILPLDSDDIIYDNFIDEAVRIMENDDQVKVVTSEAALFGDKDGPYNLPNFSLFGLAHRNMILACSLYKKSDWEKIGGYCTEIPGREDWEFWISLLKTGGKVVKLPLVGFKIRIHQNSRNNQTRKNKRQIFDLLNKRHSEFFKEQINGPLHIHRNYSKPYNSFLSFCGLLKK